MREPLRDLSIAGPSTVAGTLLRSGRRRRGRGPRVSGTDRRLLVTRWHAEHRVADPGSGGGRRWLWTCRWPCRYAGSPCATRSSRPVEYEARSTGGREPRAWRALACNARAGKQARIAPPPRIAPSSRSRKTGRCMSGTAVAAHDRSDSRPRGARCDGRAQEVARGEVGTTSRLSEHRSRALFPRRLRAARPPPWPRPRRSWEARQGRRHHG